MKQLFFLKKMKVSISGPPLLVHCTLCLKNYIFLLCCLVYKFCRNGGFTTFDNLDIKLFIFQAPDIYIELK